MCFYVFLSIKDRIKFLQFSRFSKYCEQYFRINFENKFNFQAFHPALITGQKIKECVVAFDPSYIPREGSVLENYLYFKDVSNYLVADAFFSKRTVVDPVLSSRMHFFNRLCDDASL